MKYILFLVLIASGAQAASLKCSIVTESNGVQTEVASNIVEAGTTSFLKSGNYQGEVRRNGVNTILILNDTSSGMATYTNFQCNEEGSSDLINHKTKEKVSIRCSSSISSDKNIYNGNSKKEKMIPVNEKTKNPQTTNN